MANNIRVELDIPKVLKRTKRNWGDGLYRLASSIREDCNEYVRVDQGQLRQSSYSASRLSEGKIIWNTPYARRVYYTGTPRKTINPNATRMWGEVAKKKHLEEWRTLAARLLGGK